MSATVDAATKTKPHEPDAVDQRLLNELQSDFPLVAQPFAALADRVADEGPALTEAQVIERVAAMKDGKLIRQISAIFDSRRLGYRTSLVAMQFEPEDLEAGAEVINQHPGVSHNYKRNHRYNLWFTIAVPPGRALEDDVAVLADKARPVKTWLLPTLKLFKIGVNLDMTGGDVAAQEADETNIGLRSAKLWREEVGAPELTEEELAAIRALQADLPLAPRPFDTLGAGHGLSGDRLIALAQDFIDRRLMRRFAAVLRHRQAGFRANAMGVWVCPEERLEDVGQTMASFKAVSHCYRRPTYPDWPYNLFTMIHGRHKDDCEAVVEAIREATGLEEYALLYSTKEYKKTRVRYFLDDDAFAVDSIVGR